MPQAFIDPLDSRKDTTKYGNSVVYAAATGNGTLESPYIPIVQVEGGGGGGGSAATGATEITLSALNTKIPGQAILGLLPVDTLGSPGSSQVRTTSGTAANIVLTTTCRRVSMFATQGTWYSISGTATNSSHYIGTNERLDFDVPASTTISVLQEMTAGSIRITELT
jgi:hypothetical protein